MTVVHVTKHPYERATRTVMQARWIDGSVILTPTIASSPAEIPNERLSAIALVKAIRQKPMAIVFHEQGTLNYLLAALVLRPIIGSRSTHFVYDVHDLYSYPKFRFRISEFHHHLKKFLEFWVFKSPSIRVMTVSNGLASYLKEKYGNRPAVVRSISKIDIQTPSTIRRGLVYFGAGLNIFSVNVVPHLSESLSIDYYDIKNNAADIDKKYINYIGQYSSKDLSFLLKYQALVVGLNPGMDRVKNYNTCYSLPNKFFQSLANCLPVIAEGNFIESQGYFRRLDGFFYSWDGSKERLFEILQEINLRRFGLMEGDVQMIGAFLDDAEREAREIYANLISLM